MRRLGTFEPFQFVYPGRYFSPDGRNLVPLQDFVPVNGRPFSAGPSAVYDPRTCAPRKKSAQHGCQCHGKCGSCKSGMSGLGAVVPTGWWATISPGPIYIPRRLRGLGQDDGSGGGFDSGGDWTDVGGGGTGDSIFGGGGASGGTAFFDPGLTSGSTPDTGTGVTPDLFTQGDLNALAPTAGPDAGFTATLDPSSGQFILPDGSTMSATTGQILQPDGTDVFPDGSKVLPDGTYVDANGNRFAADSAPAMAAQQQANNSRPSSGGGGSGFSSGGSKGGGSSQQQQQQLTQLQLICLQNPTLAICRSNQAQLISSLSNTAGTLLAAQAGITPAQFAAQNAALTPQAAVSQTSTGFSFSSIPTMGWLLLGIVAVGFAFK